MTLRTGHGAGAGTLRVEVMPADELPLGVPGPKVEMLGPGRKDQGKNRLAPYLDPDLPIAPFEEDATAFHEAHRTELAETVGGGVCGAAPSSIALVAAEQRAWFRYFFAKAKTYDDVELSMDLVMKGSKLGNDHRQNCLAAHELCAREALARAARPREAIKSELSQASELNATPPED